MKGTRSVFVVMAMVAFVALVAPAAGQGKTARSVFQWSVSPAGPVFTHYDFGARGFGSRVARTFRLRNVGPTKSGELSISVTGPTFTTTSDTCTGKRIGKGRSCWVGVAYSPLRAAPGDSGVLWAYDWGRQRSRATGLSGRCAGSASASEHVYWLDGIDGTVNAAPTGGGCVTTLASGQENPISLAVDDKHVYWTDLGSGGLGPPDGSVNEVPIGGGSVTTLASGQIGSSVATDGTNVYFLGGVDRAGTVNEVPVGGGSVTTLATGQNFPTSLAVDSTHVYWTDSGAGLPGTVNEVPIGGGAVTTLATGGSPDAVAVDATHVYWADPASWFGGIPGVYEVPVGGGTVTTIAAVVRPGAVAVDGTHVYWTELGAGDFQGMVKEAPSGGGAVTTLATGQEYPNSLAVDGTHVYWAGYGNFDPGSISYEHASVSEVPLGGGSVTTLAWGQRQPAAVAVGP